VSKTTQECFEKLKEAVFAFIGVVLFELGIESLIRRLTSERNTKENLIKRIRSSWLDFVVVLLLISLFTASSWTGRRTYKIKIYSGGKLIETFTGVKYWRSGVSEEA